MNSSWDNKEIKPTHECLPLIFQVLKNPQTSPYNLKGLLLSFSAVHGWLLDLFFRVVVIISKCDGLLCLFLNFQVQPRCRSRSDSLAMAMSGRGCTCYLLLCKHLYSRADLNLPRRLSVFPELGPCGWWFCVISPEWPLIPWSVVLLRLSTWVLWPVSFPVTHLLSSPFLSTCKSCNNGYNASNHCILLRPVHAVNQME